MATVTACKYESGAGRALAFGLPTTRHFRITFNYWAPNPDATGVLAKYAALVGSASEGAVTDKYL